MPKKKDVEWGRWARYYVGRGLELFGLIVVSYSIFLFFGSSQMRPMLAMTGTGAAFFVVGWLLAKDDPNRRK